MLCFRGDRPRGGVPTRELLNALMREASPRLAWSPIANLGKVVCMKESS